MICAEFKFCSISKVPKALSMASKP